MDHPQVQVVSERDALLTAFGKKTLDDRYLLPGETYQGLFARVAEAYSDDIDHAQRIYDYMSKLWFMPSTPILSNGGAGRGLPISCFLNEVPDSLDGIREIWNENVDLAAQGGGIGTGWSGVRSIGENVGRAGQTSGIIPFIRVMDSLTLAISQGSLRRGSAAVYLDVTHPEIEEFLEIRKPTGDANRKALNIHHGITIPDAFMDAVREGHEWELRSPKTNEALKTVDARALWQRILDTRLQTGEPYLVFVDTANRKLPRFQFDVGLRVKQSNLCAEIMLGVDESRTAVCCLSSVNAERWDEWQHEPMFIEDIMRFLDNVLQDFIDRAPDTMAKAVFSATRERSVGLGLMGFHSFLQAKGIPFESAMAKSYNMRFFRHLRAEADKASRALAFERGACPDAADAGVMERFAHKLAVAPTASISIICGGTSASIEPIPSNIYVAKTLSGSFPVYNPYLQTALERVAEREGLDDHWIEEQWIDILEHDGSVQHLMYLEEHERAVFKTAFELDQRWIIDLAGDRADSICQAQSVNIFLPGDVDKWDLHMLHYTAWAKGVKSLYYLRSRSTERAAHAGSDTAIITEVANDIDRTDYDECLACQ